MSEAIHVGHHPSESCRGECPTATTDDIAAVRAWLVELPCSDAQDWDAGSMPNKDHCDGTGRRFPALSRECPEHDSQGRAYRGCDCTDGRVEAFTLEAVMEYGDKWELGRQDGGWWCHREFSPGGGRGYGPTPLEAAIRALAAAEKAREGA